MESKELDIINKITKASKITRVISKPSEGCGCNELKPHKNK